jgi:tetratricopeptide (TPR) repeat protein
VPLREDFPTGPSSRFEPRISLEVASSLNNLAFLYRAQSRYGEAEPLYRKALQLSEKVLGSEHPNTLTMQLNFVVLRVNQERLSEALAELGRMEPRLLRRAGTLVYTTEQAWVRGQLLFSLEGFSGRFGGTEACTRASGLRPGLVKDRRGREGRFGAAHQLMV